LVLVASLQSISVARAAPEAEPHLRVLYSAPAPCPDSVEFERQVRRLRPEVTSAARSTLDVRIERDARGFVGTLRVPESSDGSLARELVSPDCAELAKALALVGAVLIDPSAQERADGAPIGAEPDAASPPTPDPADRRPQPTSRPSAAASVDSARPTPTAPAGEGAHLDSERESPQRWSVVLGTGLSVKSGVAPELTLGPSAAVGLRRALGSARHSLEGRASVTRTSSGKVEKVIGDARLRWTSARVDACGTLHLGSSAALCSCVVVEAGELRADASRAVNATTRRALWLAPGGALRAGFALIGPLAATVEGTVTRPLVRPRFFFARASSGAAPETVYDVPPLAFGGTLGIAVQIE
jgi:hypothetical protein